MRSGGETAEFRIGERWGEARGVDECMAEVMRGRWRGQCVCVQVEGFERCSQRTQQQLCAGCEVSEPCFWAALVEERAFRTSTGLPPGVRGGVEGARRRFILGELSDAELMVRYRRAVSELNVGVVRQVA